MLPLIDSSLILHLRKLKKHNRLPPIALLTCTTAYTSPRLSSILALVWSQPLPIERKGVVHNPGSARICGMCCGYKYCSLCLGVCNSNNEHQ